MKENIKQIKEKLQAQGTLRVPVALVALLWPTIGLLELPKHPHPFKMRLSEYK